jgi:hypothetical protein
MRKRRSQEIQRCKPWRKRGLRPLHICSTPVAEFIDPDWGDKVDSGIALSYRSARLHGLLTVTTTLWRSQLYPPVRDLHRYPLTPWTWTPPRHIEQPFPSPPET